MNRRTLLIRLSPTLRIGFDESAPTRQLWIDPFLYCETGDVVAGSFLAPRSPARDISRPQLEQPDRIRPRLHLLGMARESPAVRRDPLEKQIARLATGLAEQDPTSGRQVRAPERLEERPLLLLIQNVGAEDQVERFAAQAKIGRAH